MIDDKATFKRLKKTNGKVLLEPANEKYEPIELKENMNIKLYKVIMSVKRKKF